MEYLAIIKYLMMALDIVPRMLAAGQDIAEFVKKTSDKVANMQKEGRGPTAEEKRELDKIIDDLRARLHDRDDPNS